MYDFPRPFTAKAFSIPEKKRVLGGARGIRSSLRLAKIQGRATLVFYVLGAFNCENIYLHKKWDFSNKRDRKNKIYRNLEAELAICVLSVHLDGLSPRERGNYHHLVEEEEMPALNFFLLRKHSHCNGVERKKRLSTPFESKI